ncbi:hypothetical protein BH11ARM2_BH11ARM2_06750 [soil metagenome]
MTFDRQNVEPDLLAESRVTFLDRVISLPEAGERAGFRAFVFARSLFESASEEGIWADPSVTHSDFGEAVFEFWQGKRKVTVYVGDESTEFVKV